MKYECTQIIKSVTRTRKKFFDNSKRYLIDDKIKLLKVAAKKAILIYTYIIYRYFYFSISACFISFCIDAHARKKF